MMRSLADAGEFSDLEKQILTTSLSLKDILVTIEVFRTNGSYILATYREIARKSIFVLMRLALLTNDSCFETTRLEHLVDKLSRPISKERRHITKSERKNVVAHLS
jgi:hypothetical protein